MPIANITINRNASQEAQDLYNLLTLCWQSSALATKVLSMMQQMNDGTTYTALETAYGLPTGQGSTVYSLVFSLANGNSTLGTGFGAGTFTQFMSRLN